MKKYNKAEYLKFSKLDMTVLSENQKDKLAKHLNKLGYRPDSIWTDFSENYLYCFDDNIYDTGITKRVFQSHEFKEITYNNIFTSFKNKLK